MTWKPTKKYWSAYAALNGKLPNGNEGVKSLCGEAIDIPATPIAPTLRSSNPEKKNRVRRNTEAGLQMKLYAWMKALDLPAHSIPNEGNRGQIATHRLKLMGLWPGASDLFLARMCQGYGGYYIELKSPGEKPRPNQVEFMARMRKEGYKAEWFDNLAESQQSVLEYLGMTKAC